MQFKAYFQDISDDKIEEIIEYLKVQLSDEIQKAVENGIPSDIAEREIMDNFLNCNNFGFTYELPRQDRG